MFDVQGKRCSTPRCISFDLACLLFDIVFVYARYHCKCYGANSVANIITLILCAHHHRHEGSIGSDIARGSPPLPLENTRIYFA